MKIQNSIKEPTPSNDLKEKNTKTSKISGNSYWETLVEEMDNFSCVIIKHPDNTIE